MNEPAFDAILQRLVDADVEFVLVGGLALGAWGVVRGTRDVDIVVAPDTENLERLGKLAAALHGHVQSGESFASSSISIAAHVGSGKQTSIETDLGRLDVIQGLDGVPSYEKLRARAVETDVLDVRVAVCSLEDLKAMKRLAGRTRDLADLEDLNAADT